VTVYSGWGEAGQPPSRPRSCYPPRKHQTLGPWRSAPPSATTTSTTSAACSGSWASRGGQHRLPRALRAAAPGPGVRRHRGQRRRQLRLEKGMGLVNDVFDDGRLAGLPGSLAIGHVRYSTSGRHRGGERAADPDRLPPRPIAPGPQRQPGQRRHPQAGAGGGRLDLPVHLGYRGDPAPVRALPTGPAWRTRSRRACPRSRCLLAALPDPGVPGGGPRPWGSGRW